MNKIKLFVIALLLSVSSLSILAQHTFAATRTWTGAGGNANMTTAGNWGGTAPVAGDVLIFPANITNRTVTNDFTAATSFASITFSGATTAASAYTITGNSITLAGNITDSTTGNFSAGNTINLPIILSATTTVTVPDSAYLTLGGVISGSGALVLAGAGNLELSGTNTYAGTTTVSAGIVVARGTAALGTAVGGTTVASNAKLILVSPGEGTFNEPLNLTGQHALTVATSYGGGGTATPPFSLVTLAGNVTLGSNVSIDIASHDVKVTGDCTGTYTLTPAQGADGTLEIASASNTCASANGVQQPPAFTTAYATDQTGTPISVVNNETAIVTGTVGDVFVDYGGTLKGTGTTGEVSTASGATVAPGLSPGCLTSGDLTLVAGSTYQAEIGGADVCTGYDQLKVTGAVDITDATLTTSLYNSFKPAVGGTYTIIDNDGSDPVIGTFGDLAEGATFTVDGYVFKVSYVGGDGNDVTLTVQSVPATPDTGFAFIKSNPLVAVSVVLAAAIAIAFVARRTTQTRTNYARRR